MDEFSMKFGGDDLHDEQIIYTEFHQKVQSSARKEKSIHIYVCECVCVFILDRRKFDDHLTHFKIECFEEIWYQ